jgi:hypothetical protein
MDLDSSNWTEGEPRNPFSPPLQSSPYTGDDAKPSGPNLDFLYRYHGKMAANGVNGYKTSYDKTYDTENIENVQSRDYRSPPKATFGGKVKNHYRRFVKPFSNSCILFYVYGFES